MKLINIKIGEAKQSPTNTKGRNEGKSFDDLVASIKEKGILMPVLARKVGSVYEVIAGNRRLAAAKVAGLTEIPAQIVEMNDVEAREAQIVENLQRQDIHPLDEGEAYRKLIEASKPRYEVKDVALKVGKSETFVRQRLALTNLSEKCAKAFRGGSMNISEAVLLSRIEDEKLQNEAWRENEGHDLERMREWIANKIFIKTLSNPKGTEIDLNQGQNLFGDKTLGTDPVQFAQKMALAIDTKIAEAESKGEKMVKICTMYGKPDMKGVLGRDQYKKLESKEEKKNAKECILGIVVEGDDLGRVYSISTDPSDMKESDTGGSVYKLSPAEKAKRKKENAIVAKKKEVARVKFLETILKVKSPLSPKHLDALVDLILDNRGFSIQQPLVNLMGLDPVMKKDSYGQKDKDGKIKMVRDYEATLRKYAKENGANGKMQVVFALLMSQPDIRYMENFNKDIARI